MDEYGGKKGGSGTVFILLGMVGVLAVVGGVIFLLFSELRGQSGTEQALAQARVLEATRPAPADLPAGAPAAVPAEIPVDRPADARPPEASENSPLPEDRPVDGGDGGVQEVESKEEMIERLSGGDPEKRAQYERIFGAIEKATGFSPLTGKPGTPDKAAETGPEAGDPSSEESEPEAEAEVEAVSGRAGAPEKRLDRKQTAVRGCKEDDGGGKIYRAGRAWGRYKNGRRFNLRDRCQDGRHIVEYWCERRTLVEARFDCLDPRFASYRFTGCRKGACVRARR